MRIADERIKEFKSRLIPKMKAVNDGLKAFADPSFQLLLVDTQKAAIVLLDLHIEIPPKTFIQNDIISKLS